MKPEQTELFAPPPVYRPSWLSTTRRVRKESQRQEKKPVAAESRSTPDGKAAGANDR